MKIYFVGAHSTGKTTCARYVSETYKLPMITEVARAVLSEKELHLDSLRYNLDLVDDYQESIFYRQIEEESKYTQYVSDRSFDCLAYAAQHSRILNKLIQTNEIKKYIESLWSNNSIIFFVRPSRATMKNDGVRESVNWDGVISIDSMVKFMLEMFDLKYFQINIENMQERIRLIDSVIGLSDLKG
jgi:nicotinamide riboside kinase